MSTETILLRIHGPPGTGKTQTIVALLDLHGRPGNPACCLSGANLAVDNACKRGRKEGVEIVRIGNIEGDKVDESMRPFCLEQMAIEAKGSGKKQNAKKARRAWMRAHINEEASVVGSTCTTVCANYLQDTAYSFIAVDEACQVNEPSTVAPLSKLKIGGRVALVGDPQQLGCVCISAGAGGAGLETSLYERLEDVSAVPKCLLRIQYRMHPSISKWPNSEFYFKLRNSESVSHLTKPYGFPWAAESSTACIHVQGEEFKRGDSFYNKAEAAVVWKVRAALLKGRCVHHEDIGILTWYDAQNKYLCKNFDMSDSTVANVDGFQGSERSVMILSTVRTSKSGNIGFTKEPRRMNVALTRAKRALIVIGDLVALLEGDSYGHWKSWLQQVPIFNDQFQRIHDFNFHSSTCSMDVSQKTQGAREGERAQVRLCWQKRVSWKFIPLCASSNDGLQTKCVEAATKVLHNVAWRHVCQLVVHLPKHKYGVAERPLDFREWDRKAWSHINECVGLCLAQDPGNLIFSWLCVCSYGE